MSRTIPSRPDSESATASAVDRSGARILFLAHRVPYPPDKGDRIRTFHLMKSLSRIATIDLACLADEPFATSTIEVLHRYCDRVEVVPLGKVRRWTRALASFARGRTVTEGAFEAPELRATLRTWARTTRFHAAIASASSLAPYLQMEELRQIPAVVDLMDVDSQKWFDYAEASPVPWSWLYRTEGHRLRRLERSLMGWVRAVTLVSEAEADLFRRSCADGAVHAVTLGVDLETYRTTPQSDEQRGCVFVGALDYRPNVDGAVWFCQDIWPEVHRQHPDAILSLVGRRPVPAIRRLARLPGVEVVGQVPDVRPYLAQAAVAVVPLRIARGLQSKLLEALAMNKAVVTSPKATTGLRVQPGVHLLTALTPTDWIEAISRLIADEDLRRRLGTAGRRYVEAHHHWDRCLEPFGPLLGLTDRSASAPKATA